MIVLTILAWFFAGILALLLILILLMLPSVRIYFSASQGNIKASVRYLLFSYRLHPRPEKPEKAGKPPKEPKAQPEAPPGEKADKPSVMGALEQYKPLLRGAKKAAGYVCKRVVIYKVRARIKIGGPDAHAAALRYAGVSSFAAILTQVLGHLFTLRKTDVQITPDLIHEQSEYEVSLRVRIRPIYLFIASARLIPALLATHKKSRKGGKKYERAASYQ